MIWNFALSFYIVYAFIRLGHFFKVVERHDERCAHAECSCKLVLTLIRKSQGAVCWRPNISWLVEVQFNNIPSCSQIQWVSYGRDKKVTRQCISAVYFNNVTYYSWLYGQFIRSFKWEVFEANSTPGIVWDVLQVYIATGISAFCNWTSWD